MEEIIEVKQPEKINILTKENIILFACCMTLGILFDVLFFDKPMGISCLIFLLAFYGIFLWRMNKYLKYGFDAAWLLSVPIAALSLAFVIFSNDLFRVLNILTIPVLIVAQTVMLSKNNKFKWFSAMFVGDIFYGIFIRTLVNIFEPFVILGELLKRKRIPGKNEYVGKILIGLAISVPLLFVVTMLLASADQVFEHYLGNLPNIFENMELDRIVAQTIFALVIGFASFSYIYSLVVPKLQGIEKTPEDSKTLKKFWDPVIVITVLVSINLVYVLFAFIQFTYLFGSLNLGLPESFTYAEYARRGFFELVFVTLINLSILLGCIVFAKENGGKADKTIKMLLSLLVACTMVMLVSAHIRMSLYEEAYGYTYLRLLTHAFMIFIFVLLSIAVLKVWMDRIQVLKWYIVAGLSAYVILNYVNIDVMIAKNNIERYHKTNNIDIHYLTELSCDAVPYTLELLNDKNKNIAVGIENGLYLKKKKLEKKAHWQSFNISEFKAKKTLSKLELKFDETLINNSDIYRD